MTEKIERALVVTAHPDDSEFGAAGTIAKLVRDGCEVAYVVVTNGNKGSGDPSMTPERLARIREDEQRNAARALGVERVQFLGYEDGEVEDTRELRRDVSREIRRFRPDLVICQSPNRTYNLGASHRDHRTVGGVTLDCVYPLARDHLAFPELLAEFEPHKVREVYVMQWESPQLVVDIGDVFDLKLKALACHQSQFANFAALEARVRERAAELGRAHGFAYAEAFDRVVLMR
jgi:LmbE family N-acetylglucosaminyl deacetylase